jgi:hypothetical protein
MPSSDEQLQLAKDLVVIEKEHSLRIASEKVTKVLEMRIEMG